MAGDEDAEDFRAAVSGVAAAGFGADPEELAAFTGYPTDFAASVSQRMRNWPLGRRFCERRLVQEGDLEDQIRPAFFGTHVLAAQGLLTVLGHDENGKAIFAAAENRPTVQ